MSKNSSGKTEVKIVTVVPKTETAGENPKVPVRPPRAVAKDIAIRGENPIVTVRPPEES